MRESSYSFRNATIGSIKCSGRKIGRHQRRPNKVPVAITRTHGSLHFISNRNDSIGFDAVVPPARLLRPRSRPTPALHAVPALPGAALRPGAAESLSRWCAVQRCTPPSRIGLRVGMASGRAANTLQRPARVISWLIVPSIWAACSAYPRPASVSLPAAAISLTASA